MILTSMTRLSEYIFITLLLCIMSTDAFAQISESTVANAQISEDALTTSAPQTAVSRTSALAIGSTDRLDTYLSPISYTGIDIRFLSSVTRFRKSHWDIQFNHDGGIDYTKNNSKTASQIAGHYDFTFAMLHRWDLLDGNLSLSIGGMTTLNIGFAYIIRNSNNPAQAYASIAIGGAGTARYRLPFKTCKRNISICYEARLPLCGIMFSPNFGQSYYEIFNRGNYDNNVVFTSIATPSFRHQFSIDIPIGKSLSVHAGYLGDIRQAKPNHLFQHTYTHSAIIGFTRIL